jgi:hypothetical protein
VDYINFDSRTYTPEVYYTSSEFDIVKGDETGLIIDGIPYPLERGWGFEPLNMTRDFAVMLKFNTGDLTISANRESVQYDDETVALISKKINHVFDELVVMLYTVLGGFENYLAACIFKAKLENNQMPNLVEGDNIFNIVVSSIGTSNYTRYVLKNTYETAQFTFGGREVVNKVSYKHHSIQRVINVETVATRSRVKVYKSLTTLPLTMLNGTTMFYGDKKGDSRRNATIFEEMVSDDRFYMITPLSFSTDKEAEEEICTMRDLFGIHYHNYSEVEQIKIDRTPTKRVANKIPARENEGYYSENLDLYYDKVNNKLYHDEGCTRELNKDVYCFHPVSRVASVLSYTTRTKFEIIPSIKKVILVNTENFDKKVSKCGYSSALEVCKEVVDKNTITWLEEAEKYIYGDIINEIAPNILNYIDILPKGVLPSSFDKFKKEDLNSYRKFSRSYDLVQNQVKVDRLGIEGKLKDNLSKYPMLITYISHSEEHSRVKKEVIKQYFNQVNK